MDKSKGRPETPPVKTRRRTTMLPSSSLAKEQLELKDRIPYVRLDATIIEADEITSSGNFLKLLFIIDCSIVFHSICILI